MLLADVTVPYGDWVSTAVGALQPIATLALTGIVSYIVAAYVPPWLKMFAGSAAQDRVNQVITNAVNSAVARTQGYLKDQALTIPVAGEILGKAVQYAVDQAPDLIKNVTSGKLDNLMNMVLARMKAAGIPSVDGDAAKQEAVEKTDFTNALDALSGKPPTPPGKPSKAPLQLGSKGEDVKTLQRKLGIAADGTFGPATETAVKNFQTVHGLTPDGVVGPATKKALGV